MSVFVLSAQCTFTLKWGLGRGETLCLVPKIILSLSNKAGNRNQVACCKGSVFYQLLSPQCIQGLRFYHFAFQPPLFYFPFSLATGTIVLFLHRYLLTSILSKYNFQLLGILAPERDWKIHFISSHSHFQLLLSRPRNEISRRKKR